MRYVKPGAAAVAKVAELLDITRANAANCTVQRPSSRRDCREADARSATSQRVHCGWPKLQENPA
jgi:hypothetical protein